MGTTTGTEMTPPTIFPQPHRHPSEVTVGAALAGMAESWFEFEDIFDFVCDKSSIDNFVTTKVAACGGLIDFEGWFALV